MRLSAKILKNIASVNQWEFADSAHVQEGQTNSFYFQLVDLDMTPVEGDSENLPEHPMRFLPQGSVIAVEITFPALRNESDDTGIEEFTVAASQPFSDDKSIWRIDLSSSQTPRSGNFKGKLTIDGSDQFFIVINALKTSQLEVGSC